MAELELADETRGKMTQAWQRYLGSALPFRPDLFRYCRKLTGDVWDAEDLVQDTLLRGFGTLASVHHAIDNPRAYLLRIASNLWIDTIRRRGHDRKLLSEQGRDAVDAPVAPPSPAEAAEVRDAAAELMLRLAPQERACVVLKDVFEMSLDETAKVLGTTVGAVKSALHRGRARLREPEPVERPQPSAGLIDQFVERYNARDLPGLLGLMLDSASVEIPGYLVETGREAFARKGGWFDHNFEYPPELGHSAPRWERALFQGEIVVLVYSTYESREGLVSVMRLEEHEGRVARIRAYVTCPETVHEVGAALGLEVHTLARFPTRPSA